ncbi:MAG: HAMP domain-containing methyl-accepting chemotaxis protein [Myxococcota bacterium]
MSIHRKVLLSLGASTLIVATAFVIGLMLAGSQRRAIDGLGQLAARLGDDVMDLVDATSAMKLDVVQVQQFLTDLSATRGLDGLDDGDDEAAGFARKFADDSSRARLAANKLGYGEIARAIDAAGDAFGPYYETGKKMAVLYVNEGPSGGNAFMPKFDAASEAIAGALDLVLEQTAKRADTIAKDAHAQSQEAEAGGQLAVLNLIVLGALVMGLLLIGALLLWRGVTRPMEHLAADMAAIGRGDLERAVEGAARKDELGRMARSLESFRAEQRKLRSLEAEAAEREARADRERKETLAAMADSLETTIAQALDAISNSAVDMRNEASQLASSASDASHRADGVSTASTRAADNVSGVAAAAQQLAASIAEINHQVTNARQTSAAAVKEATITNEAMGLLTQAVKKIGDIVQVISGIANQTNLLALNATIEAARAGHAGSGFSVVAREVRNLAVESGKSAEDIKRQIDGMHTAVAQVMGAISRVGDTIGRIDGFSAAIAAGVEQQRAATESIAENVQNAAAGTQLVSSHISSVGAAAEQTGQAASRMLDVATLLSDESGRLDREVHRFIERVRAA